MPPVSAFVQISVEVLTWFWLNVSEWVEELGTSVLTVEVETVVAIGMNLTKDNMQFINRHTDTFTVK